MKPRRDVGLRFSLTYLTVTLGFRISGTVLPKPHLRWKMNDADPTGPSRWALHPKASALSPKPKEP